MWLVALPAELITRRLFWFVQHEHALMGASP